MLKTTISLFVKLLLILLALFVAGTARAVEPFLVKDINTQPTGSSDPAEFTQVGSTTFFVATALGSGRELWATDGTPAGTRLVKDISPGPASSDPSWLTRWGNELYFAVDTRDATRGLWVSDGTAAGTVQVDGFGGMRELTIFNGDLYFYGYRPVSPFDSGLYRRTTAPPGTSFVSDTGFIRDLLVSGGRLMFVDGHHLWTSDGTPAGTSLVWDPNPGGGGSLADLVDVNGTLFLAATTGGSTSTLWKSDGTPAGTVEVRTLSPRPLDPTELARVGNTLFFAAYTDETTGVELWKSDGTSAGTVQVADIAPAWRDSNPASITEFGGVAYFAADDGTHGVELWRSNGTAAGTYLFKQSNWGPGGTQVGADGNPDHLTVVGSFLFYTAKEHSAGTELYFSAGAPTSTFRLKDIHVGTGSSDPRQLADIGGTLFCSANDGVAGQEVWTSNGTGVGTALLMDIHAGGGSSFPSDLIEVGGRVYFVATDGVSGYEPWRSDGTPGGTVMIEDISPGIGSSILDGCGCWAHCSDYQPFVESSGVVYFPAHNGASGCELWRTDGTEAGTYMVRNINITVYEGAEIEELTDVNGTLFFVANDGINGEQLWRSDGTAAGTMPVTQLSDAEAFTAVNDTLFFTRWVGSYSNVGLWRSDGTEAGTVPLVINPDPEHGSFPEELTKYWSHLVFTADDGTSGRELWTSDGTVAGTVRVANINPFGDSNPADLTFSNGVLYFSADDGSVGTELWRSNSTEAGTWLVKDIAPGTPSGTGTVLEGASGPLFLRAAASGTSWHDLLWVSDGTSAGTVEISELIPVSMKAIGDEVYFSADDDTFSWEPWKSDGTPEGTVRVGDINPGSARSRPGSFTRLGSHVLFEAKQEAIGTELWAVEIDRDNDGIGLTVDCDDTDADVYPGAPQICDSLNNDCDHPNWPALTGTNETDLDGDFWTECAGDCAGQDGTVYPDAPQICDGQNNDCNDPAWPALSGTNEADIDGDSWAECNGDCSPLDGATYPGAPQVCDGVNNDCNDPVWPALTGTHEVDLDGDTYSECAGDCAPLDGDTYPGAIETNDEQDNQCPGDGGYGMIDEIEGISGFHDPAEKRFFSWTAQPDCYGYQVARAIAPDFSSGCTAHWVLNETYISDWDTPGAGEVFYYLVRAHDSSGSGSWGRGSDLIERTVWCAEEYDCFDSIDNDGDGNTDCYDDDCAWQCS